MQIELSSDKLPDRLYSVNFKPNEFSVFEDWFSHLTDHKLDIVINGEKYCFSNAQEKACFSYGLSQMLKMMQPKRNIIEKLRTEIMSADKKIFSLLSMLKSN